MKTDAFRQIADSLDGTAKMVRDHGSRGGMLREDTMSLADELHAAAMLLRGATNCALEDYARAYSGRAKREDEA